ncbi:hypothetical protein ACJMK2_015995 [Sinanodonta woodiana]|uniref:BTB domain-containing protein n=1 Tax=Sinanodonta woodiana TaxID=1069815 RepID=A0ABD3UV02_SINWO
MASTGKEKVEDADLFKEKGYVRNEVRSSKIKRFFLPDFQRPHEYVSSRPSEQRSSSGVHSKSWNDHSRNGCESPSRFDRQPLSSTPTKLSVKKELKESKGHSSISGSVSSHSEDFVCDFKPSIAESMGKDDHEYTEDEYRKKRVEEFIKHAKDNKETAKSKIGDGATTMDDDVIHVDGGLSCRLFYVDQNSVLKPMGTFGDLSRYLMETVINESTLCDDNDLDMDISTISGISLNQIAHRVITGANIEVLFKEDRLKDVIIEVEDRRFYAHRFALACNSLYFAELFNNKITEKTLPCHIQLRGISAESFEEFLHFVYTGDVRTTDKTAADLVLVADYLQVTRLLWKCKCIIEKLPAEQLLKLVNRNRVITSPDVYEQLYQRVLKDVYALRKCDGFLQLDVDTVCSILSSDLLNISSEQDVFQAAVQWIMYDVADRLKYGLRLMSCVRFSYMTNEELFTCVETTSLMNGHDKFKDMILVACWQITGRTLKRDDPFMFVDKPARVCYKTNQMMHPYARAVASFHSCKSDNQTGTVADAQNQSIEIEEGVHDSQSMKSLPENSEFFQPARTSTPKNERPARDTSIVYDLFLIGEFKVDESKESKLQKRHDLCENQWIEYICLPEPNCHHAVTAHMGKLYLIGGSKVPGLDQKEVPSKKNFEFNPEKMEWAILPTLGTARMQHCAQSLFGMVYAIGGVDELGKVMSSVECYSILNKNWFYVNPMFTARKGASAGVLNGKLLVAGGIGESNDVPSTVQVLNCVELFDPRTNSWTKLNNLRFPRCYTNIVNVQGRIYICGGATRSYNCKNSVLNSVSSIDIYEPKTDHWSLATNMVFPRHSAGAAVIGDQIYIIGGMSSHNNRLLQSVECYDTTRGVWATNIQDIPFPAKWIHCVTMTSQRKDG